MINIQYFKKSLNDRAVAVFGLGLSGLSTIRALSAAGVKTYAWDDNPAARDQAKALGPEVAELTEAVLQNCAALVLAPGVPLHFPQPHSVVQAARKAGIEIIGDLEILHRAAHGFKTIGITGTNGKSTTTALTAHILNEAGKRSSMGGNIGKPVLDLEAPALDGAFVLEVSSYQMDLCPNFRPDIAVLLNITPDHIDRHGSFENYAAAKEKLLEGEGVAIISIDDAPCAEIYKRLLAHSKRRIIPISCEQTLEQGITVRDGQLYDRTQGTEIHAGSLNGIATLCGVHNHQNAAAAYAVCRSMGLAPDEILKHMRTYPGLAHRQYPVRTINGVAYINDSKATNAVSTAKALGAYNNIYWIAGGRPKDGGLEGLDSYCDRIKQAYLIGEAAAQFGAWLGDRGIMHHYCGTLEKALAAAHAAAQGLRGQPGGSGVVLLSPACASFDQFQSFEHRGRVFTELVEALPKDEIA
jgi:UDP-N-acetylmuramoylalanine--D-glutamate ligase